jgi:hypothetical protein
MGHPAVHSVKKKMVKNRDQVVLNRLFHRYGSHAFDEMFFSTDSCVSGP